jgi:protein involved in polysaccharide export with SLBB domain
LDFVEDYKVTIDGEIKNKGVYDFHDKLTLNDLIIQAGGLMGSASKRVEIARMIKSEENNDNNPLRAQLFNLEISAESNEQLKNFVLKPFDVINIRKMAVYEKPEMVKISGAVNYSGKYVLSNKIEKIFDMIQRAGGLTSVADINGVKIKRPIKSKQIEDLENVNVNLAKKTSMDKKENVQNSDSIQKKLVKKLKEELKFSTIPVDWKKVFKNPKSNTNVTLLPGDEIEVATYNEGVKVLGNVLLTSEIAYNRGKSFNYYISSVGGVDGKGWKKKAYIIFPNGKAAVTKTYLFFKIHPKVLPGSQIVVPEKPETTKMSVGEWVSIGSIMTSLALLMITAFK